MISKCSLKISESLLRYKIIEQDSLEIYIFGFEMLIKQFFHLSNIILMGILAKRLVETLFFIFTYSIIRTSAGGHHFKSEKVCFLSSGILVLLVVYPLNFIKWKVLIKYTPIIFSISVLLILLLAPRDTSNKPMNEIERGIFRKKTKKCLVVLSSIFIISLYLQCNLCYVVR